MSLRDGLRRLALRLRGREPSVEDERLVALFRNRIELKKELNELDDERNRLLDRLKLQEGSTMRVEEQIAALEQYLGRPEEGFKSLAYFQLKALYRTASRRVEQFSNELQRQQKDRERKAQLAAFDQDKRERTDVVERDRASARVLADQLQAEQKLARQKLAQLGGFWNYFRRRKLTEAIEARAHSIEATETLLTDLGDRVHAIKAEAPPLFEGMSLDGRRAVNLAVLGYAEQLYDRLSAGGLAELSRESTLKRVFDAHYGSPADCQAIMQRASQAAAEIDRLAEDLADIKTRADRMRRVVTYRNDTETVPLAESLSAGSAGLSRRPNMLVDEYWDVYRALVR